MKLIHGIMGHRHSPEWGEGYIAEDTNLRVKKMGNMVHFDVDQTMSGDLIVALDIPLDKWEALKREV